MKQFRPVILASVIAVVFVAGCASTAGVMSKGNDVYTINVNRGDAGKVKLRAYQHAQKYCAKVGGTMQVVNENLRGDPSYSPGASSIIDLDFKCVK
ncbi:MAG: hypothetical protein J0653_06025 [Deltaproteobacteria bacterium]|nr:hypothetical protein [Deltaproteobacteria bacterium]